ncbi:50S ribosomal protein L24e [Halobacteriales archaeon QS_4_69_225]|nr:MAG: 50S ribosomal protein L24e [Halobacteriales archaeon QS_4_69_225]
MPQTNACDYCGADVEPGTGTMFVAVDGTVTHYCSAKCEKNADLSREPRDLEWTEAGAGAPAAETAEADPEPTEESEPDPEPADEADAETPDLEAAEDETGADESEADESGDDEPEDEEVEA